MTVLRQKASELLTIQRLEKKTNAYENLLKLRKSVPELDYEKELAEYREEKFGNAIF